MKTTNQIEKALEKRIDVEIAEVVDVFIFQLKELCDTYGNGISTKWYKMVDDTQHGEKELTLLSREKVRTILQRMIKENHGEAMLAKRIRELLDFKIKIL